MRIFYAAFISLFLGSGVFTDHLFGQGIPFNLDDVREYRLIEIPKIEGREMDSLTSLEVATQFRQIIAGAPSTITQGNQSGRAFFMGKRTPNAIVPYDFVTIIPPTGGFTYRTLEDEIEVVRTTSCQCPSFGTQVAITGDGSVIAIAAPNDGPNGRGIVFVYDLAGVDIASLASPNSLDQYIIDVYVGPTYTNRPNPAPESLNFPAGKRGRVSAFQFGRQLHFNGKSPGTLTVSSLLQGPPGNNPNIPEVSSNKGILFYLRPRPIGSGQGGFQNNLLVLSPDSDEALNDDDYLGQDISVTDVGAGQVLTGIPGFDNSDLAASINPAGLAILGEFDESSENLSDFRFFRAPPGSNVAGNRFGESLEINGIGNTILIGEPGDGAQEEIFVYRNDLALLGDEQAPNPDDFIKALGQLVNPRANSHPMDSEFGGSITLSKQGNLGIVGDPGIINVGGSATGVAYFYDFTMLPDGSDFMDFEPLGDISPFELSSVKVAPISKADPTYDAHYQIEADEKLGNDLRDFGRVQLAFDQAMRFGKLSGSKLLGELVAISAETIITIPQEVDDEATSNRFEIGTDPWYNPRLMVRGRGPAGTQIHSHLILVLDADAYLPVTYVSFTAQPEEEGIMLRWETASETNNSGFAIQRSHNAVDWEEIGWMDGYGTTTSPKTYRFLDKDPYNGINYYRLEQRDYDGITEFSDMVSAWMDVSLEGLNVFPNPASDVLNVVTPPNMPVTLRLYNTQGQLLFQQVYQDGNKQVPLSRFSGGSYVLEVLNGERVIHTQKILKR